MELAIAGANARLDDDRRAEAAAAARAAERMRWEEGDGSRLASLVSPAAHALVAACAVQGDTRVLEIDLGDGTVGRAARDRGALVETQHAADTPQLAYEPVSFDCALSAFGAIHSRDPRRLTMELDRVLRPGGTIGLAVWTPSGFMGLAYALAGHVLGRADARTAARWGRYEDAYRRFGFHPGFEARDEDLVLEFSSVDEAVDVLLEAPGPLRASGQERAVLEPGLRELIEEHRVVRAEPGCEIRCAYVLVLARRPD